MGKTFICTGHGYETGRNGRCTAFDGYAVIANPLGKHGAEDRESRVFLREGGRGTNYGSHVIQLAKEADSLSRDLFLLVEHGAGREVWRIPEFYDGGALEAHILAMPERLQYALLYTIFKMVSAARREAIEEIDGKWIDAHLDGRVRKVRAKRGRPATVEIADREEAPA